MILVPRPSAFAPPLNHPCRAQPQHVDTEARWRLIKDARAAADLSTHGLRRLNKLFETAAPHSQTRVGPKTFHMCLARQGVRDAVLHGRLFSELSLLDEHGKIDYRDFLCLLAFASHERVQDKIDLIFEVYCEEHEPVTSLSLTQLLHMIMLARPREERGAVLEELEGIWTEVRRGLDAAESTPEYWMAPSVSVGLQKYELLRAIAAQPLVHAFFDRMFTTPLVPDALVRVGYSQPSQTGEGGEGGERPRDWLSGTQWIHEQGGPSSAPLASSTSELPRRRVLQRWDSWKAETHQNEEADARFLLSRQASMRPGQRRTPSRGWAHPKLRGIVSIEGLRTPPSPPSLDEVRSVAGHVSRLGQNLLKRSQFDVRTCLALSRRVADHTTEVAALPSWVRPSTPSSQTLSPIGSSGDRSAPQRGPTSAGPLRSTGSHRRILRTSPSDLALQASAEANPEAMGRARRRIVSTQATHKPAQGTKPARH